MERTPAESELVALLGIATDIASHAADLVRSGGRVVRTTVATKSSQTDPVTAMDERVEAYLRQRIHALRPDDAILGEEGDDLPGTSGLTWVIDPIDGTVNYIYGVESVAVSVAVVTGQLPGGELAEIARDPEHWIALAGCVVRVSDGRTWTAARGLGAWRDGQLLDPGERFYEPLARSLVGTGFGYDSGRRAAQARVLTQVLPKIRDIRRLGSAAIDLCLVADGTLDLYYERGLNPWDHAAGALIAAEAGLTVSGLHGRGPSSDLVVVGAGEAYADLVALLERAQADTDGEVLPVLELVETTGA